MLDNYKKEYEKINVPSKLKTETLLKMKETQEKRSTFFLKYILLSLCAIVIVFSAVLNFTLNHQRSIFEEGKVLADIQLEEGNLKFDQQEERSLFGNVKNEEIKTISKQEAESLSKTKFKEIDIAGFTLLRKEYYAFYESNQLSKVQWAYTYQKEEQEIVLNYFSESSKITTNSSINNKKVAIYYDKEGTEIFFDAYFKKGKGLIEILTSNMSQEEFTKEMVKIVKKLN